jgi:DNA-binding Lrp family transcriptional regulator
MLNSIQTGFPLTAEPYACLGRDLGVSAEEALAGVLRLRRCGVIRRIGGSFVPRRLGYISVLVAGQVVPERLAAAAARAAAFPEVTHNYEREGRYNLWFTVIAENQARLDAILDDVRTGEGVRALYSLPALKTFKLRVNFEMEEPAERGPGTTAPDAAPTPGSERAPSRAASPHPGQTTVFTADALDRRLIPLCCGDLDESDRPFARLAAAAGASEAEVLRRLTVYRNVGVLRRFGAVLRHQLAGYVANGMSVWNVAAADVDRVGTLMAGAREISHCYERGRLPGLPYNVYAMIHGASREECLAVAARVAAQTAIGDYQVLFSRREFKKTSMVYFEA